MATSNAPQYDIITPLQPAEAAPAVRAITPGDLADALAKGIADFRAMPTHALFLAVLYPIVGLLIGSLAFGYDFITLMFPIAAGFALIGPFAAIGLYELSRRREMGRDTSWHHAFDVLQSPSLGAILRLGLLLLIVFVAWVAVADWVHVAYFGKWQPASVRELFDDVFGSSQGHTMLLVGGAIGFVFAGLVLMLTVVAFPLLLDRDVGVGTAMATSLRVAFKSPLTISLWGVIVAVSLAIGSLPFFFGLAVVLPVLGHATWHLYRKAVAPAAGQRPDYRPQPKRIRYAAEFPASLFVPSSDVEER
ncbi:MAG: DUF2189 domain-containing protein [Pseudomonadota bacterium]